MLTVRWVAGNSNKSEGEEWMYQCPTIKVGQGVSKIDLRVVNRTTLGLIEIFSFEKEIQDSFDEEW